MSMSPTRCARPQQMLNEDIQVEDGREEHEPVVAAQDTSTADEAEGDVGGILNDNFENCCGHAIDLSSVESLSVALLKLESEKSSLERELSCQYESMSFTELERKIGRAHV